MIASVDDLKRMRRGRIATAHSKPASCKSVWVNWLSGVVAWEDRPRDGSAVAVALSGGVKRVHERLKRHCLPWMRRTSCCWMGRTCLGSRQGRVRRSGAGQSWNASTAGYWTAMEDCSWRTLHAVERTDAALGWMEMKKWKKNKKKHVSEADLYGGTWESRESRPRWTE